MLFNLQLSKSENIKAMFSAPKWLPVCIQFRLPIAKWRNIRSTALSKSCDNTSEHDDCQSTSCSTGKTAGSIVTESAGSTTSGCKPCSSSELTGVALGLR